MTKVQLLLLPLLLVLLLPPGLPSLPLASASSGFCGARLDPSITTSAPDAVGHAWTRMPDRMSKQYVRVGIARSKAIVENNKKQQQQQQHQHIRNGLSSVQRYIVYAAPSRRHPGAQKAPLDFVTCSSPKTSLGKKTRPGVNGSISCSHRTIKWGNLIRSSFFPMFCREYG